MKHVAPFASGGLVFLIILAACAPVMEIETEAPNRTFTFTPPATETPFVPVTGSTSTPNVIQHKVIPGELPARRINHAIDHDSSGTAEQRRPPGGDRFTFGQFERPFNAETMDIYYPDLDIQEAYVYEDDIWVYATITVEGSDPRDALPGNYALEVDVNLDGNGEFIIIARQPSLKEWTSIGVQIWSDQNDDVGGKIVMEADGIISGDGYERLTFDQGRGENADLAWVRVSPDDPSTVQIAFLHLVLVGDRAYLVNMWAGYDDLQPALFDLNDHFTHEQAGEAMPEMKSFYPINEVSGLDNTCRMAIGFEPSGKEPGLCKFLDSNP